MSSAKVNFLPKMMSFFNNIIDGSNFTHKCVFDSDHIKLFRSDDVTITQYDVKNAFWIFEGVATTKP